ncbi:hypothetical protein [Geobacillus sp. YF-1]|uniref:hypothetical protein n=1 Tax=Geobacillus sp. YF-1 TaxID=3457480 RepID=UPI0040460154
MKEKFFYPLFIGVLLLAACERGHDPTPAPHHVGKEAVQGNEQKEKAKKEQKPLSLEEKFLPPHFLVNEFTAKNEPLDSLDDALHPLGAAVSVA